MTRKTVIAAVAVLLVAGTAAALAAGSTGTSVTESTDAYAVQDNETTTAPGNETANLTVGNQTVVVNNTNVIVNINKTYLPQGGFVAITVASNDTTEANLTAPIVGNTTFLEPGLHQNETITINRTLVNQTLTENETLMAVAFEDVNGDQQFDPTEDRPIVANDQPVTEPVRVTVEGLLPDEQLGNETTTTTET